MAMASSMSHEGVRIRPSHDLRRCEDGRMHAEHGAMVPPLAFSRLQLAAALIEYDNDLDDPHAPKRSAQNSVIFAHFLRNSVDIGGAISSAGTRAAADPRRSVASFKNPFSIDSQSETGYIDDEHEEFEVNLESWGLDAFIPREKKKPLKANPKESTIHSTRHQLPSVDHESSTFIPRRAMVTSKSLSLGGLADFKCTTSIQRRHSLPLELTGLHEGSTSHADFMSPMESATQTGQAGYSGKSSTPNTRTNTLDTRNPTGENPFTIERPSRISRFDPKLTEWQGPLSRSAKEDDNVRSANEGKHHRYSTVELLRPKVLVMPSPLQTALPDGVEPEPVRKVRDGFSLSTDGPPMPPGAKSSQRLSGIGSISNPPPSEPFVSNPLDDLSLSQQTFRNTLGIHGKVSDFDPDLPRATLDGQTAQLNPTVDNERLHTTADEVPSSGTRPAGKLYGKSLIDDLEARKAELRSKQRVFKGDERPAMMARNLRPTTLIDPASLTDQSAPQNKSVQASRIARQNLLTNPDFNSHRKSTLAIPPAVPHLRESRSVFGVDTLWQHEMDRLGAIQLQEASEEKEGRKEVGRYKSKRRKMPEICQEPLEEPEKVDITLPYIQPVTAKPPLPEDSDNGSAEEGPDALSFNDHGNLSWHVDSSDEEDRQPRRRNRNPRTAVHAQTLLSGEDSDEDLPLAAIRTTGRSGSDDEDRPLAQVLRQVNIQRPSKEQGRVSRDPRNESGSDEDQPLALRTSRIPHPRQNGEDEDDIPLGLHPQHQRQTYYQMPSPLQGQIIMRQQMQNNLFMSAHTPTLYGTSMVNPLALGPVQYPVPIPSSPPVIDEVKFGRVDRWRRDVIVDGDMRR